VRLRLWGGHCSRGDALYGQRGQEHWGAVTVNQQLLAVVAHGVRGVYKEREPLLLLLLLLLLLCLLLKEQVVLQTVGVCCCWAAIQQGDLHGHQGIRVGGHGRCWVRQHTWGGWGSCCYVRGGGWDDVRDEEALGSGQHAELLLLLLQLL